MIDKLLDKLASKSSPWWVWVLVGLTFLLTCALNFRSSRLKVRKRSLELEASLKKVLARAAKTEEDRKKHRSGQGAAEAALGNLDEQIAAIDEKVSAAKDRVLRARSFSDLQ